MSRNSSPAARSGNSIKCPHCGINQIQNSNECTSCYLKIDGSFQEPKKHVEYAESQSSNFASSTHNICGQCGSEVLIRFDFCNNCGANYRRGPIKYIAISAFMAMFGVAASLDLYWWGFILLAFSVWSFWTLTRKLWYPR